MCVCVYSHSVRLFKLADLLDLVHEISAIYVLHDEIQSVLWTDAGTRGRGSQVSESQARGYRETRWRLDFRMERGGVQVEVDSDGRRVIGFCPRGQSVLG